MLYALILGDHHEIGEDVSHVNPLITRVSARSGYLESHRPSNLNHVEKRDEEYNHWSSVIGQACKISDCLR